jgi:uncharacterized protein (TIGR02466 family)
MFNEGSITGIFPTPIYRTEMIRGWTEEEKKVWQDCDWHRSIGNSTSSDVYVLDRLPELKGIVESVIGDYWNKVITTVNSVSPVLTQSWLNKTGKGDHHHRHNHSNSLISGVVYLETDSDTITFFREDRSLLSLTVEDYHLFNSPSWVFSVKSGDIILFPSDLHHMVDEKVSGTDRISLAFNVWVKGSIGVKEDMTELTIGPEFKHLRKIA